MGISYRELQTKQSREGDRSTELCIINFISLASWGQKKANASDISEE
jgi:hypothetical protein